MQGIAWWINTITILTVAVSLFRYWFLGRGVDGIKGQCMLQIVSCLLQLGYNCLIYRTNPDLWGSILYQPLLLWGLLMSVKGLKNARPHSD